MAGLAQDPVQQSFDAYVNGHASYQSAAVSKGYEPSLSPLAVSEPDSDFAYDEAGGEAAYSRQGSSDNEASDGSTYGAGHRFALQQSTHCSCFVCLSAQRVQYLERSTCTAQHSTTACMYPDLHVRM